MTNPFLLTFSLAVLSLSSAAYGQVCYQFTVDSDPTALIPVKAATLRVEISKAPYPLIGGNEMLYQGFTGPDYSVAAGNRAVLSINYPSGYYIPGVHNYGSRTMNVKQISTLTADSGVTSFTLTLGADDDTVGVVVAGTVPYTPTVNLPLPAAFPPLAAGTLQMNYSVHDPVMSEIDGIYVPIASIVSGCSAVQWTFKPLPNYLTGVGISYPMTWRDSDHTWYGLPPGFPVQTQTLGLSGDVPVPGDYDGDGRSDYAVWRPSQGLWQIKSTTTLRELDFYWGMPGDIPIGASDFDGDGKSDYAIWRPSEGNWYVLLNDTLQPIVTAWGQAGDIPIADADFDGDGKSDYAVWRPSSGEWYVLLSGTGQALVMTFGQTGDIPMSGDFDGDGKTDFAVWRPSNGTWYVFYSGHQEVAAVAWGAPGDIPIQGDFDGDGKADYVVFRPSTSEWWMNTSAHGVQSPIAWGAPTDFPIGQVITSAPPVQ
jgi:hypothetical protein